MTILEQSFYARDTVTVARELIGKILIREFNGEMLSGIITETEAYQSDDSACHAYRGQTPRNQALFGPVGHAYVYFTYGNHFCFNAVARAATVAAGGVLIRAIQPLTGIECMIKNRKKSGPKNLTDGPGKLAQALAINRELYGINLMQKGSLYIAENFNVQTFKIEATPRIGISSAQEKLWRFLMSTHEFSSE
jgi:DNA-3-methyladenine glycosylase